MGTKKKDLKFFEKEETLENPIPEAVARDPMLDENYMGFPKYSKEAPFMDPVLRCDGCGKLVRHAYLQEKGSCICGHKKVKEVRTLSQKEYDAVKAEFPDFAAVFEARPDEEVKALL